jgi:signal transduction histidine kinase
MKEGSSQQSQYVALVSHHLQDSLSAIQFCLQLVLSGSVGQVPEKVKEMISRAESQTRHLLHFIRDLLSLSRIQAVRELEMKNLSLLKIVENVIRELRPRASEKTISLELKDSTRGSPAYANRETLEQLFINLIVNAIKYTNPHGKVGVEVIEEDECFRIIVWDTGIGISQSDIEHIFDDFYRAKNAKQIEEKGTGLGLSIVKQAVDVHQGEIWVESELNKGSRFIFTLPKRKTAVALDKER